MDSPLQPAELISADQVRAIWQQYLSIRNWGKREQLSSLVEAWLRQPAVFADREAKMVAELGMDAFVSAGRRVDALLEYIFADPQIH